MTTPVGAAKKKLIEVALPLVAINKASAREKSIRRMAELLQVLPALGRNQVFGLLSELRDEGRVYVEGQRGWARWLPVVIGRREDEAAAANESKEEA